MVNFKLTIKALNFDDDDDDERTRKIEKNISLPQTIDQLLVKAPEFDRCGKSRPLLRSLRYAVAAVTTAPATKGRAPRHLEFMRSLCGVYAGRFLRFEFFAIFRNILRRR